MAKKTTTTVPEHITPQDLENKFRALQGDIQGKVDDKRTTIASVAAGTGLALLLLFFFLGKRSGKKKSAIVEIRRI
jgi:hypothetical protein